MGIYAIKRIKFVEILLKFLNLINPQLAHAVTRFHIYVCAFASIMPDTTDP